MGGPAEDRDRATGDLFGRLFPAYDDSGFHATVDLFARRWEANGFDVGWFRGKQCLDAGCGGGRYSVAMALLGARRVVGADLGRRSIEDARRRARDIGVESVAFAVASLEALPHGDASFDCVVCSGVLHHAERPEQALGEMARCLRPGGIIYLLVYATEGIRWPTVQILRPIARDIGPAALERAVAAAGLPVAKRRTFLDDLLVPRIDFYTWGRLRDLLARHGFERIERWERGRLDHEESLEAYRADLDALTSLFGAGVREERADALRARFEAGLDVCRAAVGCVRRAQDEVARGMLSEADAMRRVVGQGHHRVVARKRPA